MRLLLVEDDPMIGEALVELLHREHYAVDWVRDGIAANGALVSTPYDLVILDLSLPKRDGLSVLRALRERRNRVPVLVTTARDALEDRVAGLDAGADDYVLKPFEFDELLARIRALIRRAAGRAQTSYTRGGTVLDPVARTARVDGKEVTLSAREWAVLEPLLLRPGATLSRQQLEEKLYGWGESVNSNAVEVYVHGIRKKLGADFIRNVRGLGYLVPRE